MNNLLSLRHFINEYYQPVPKTDAMIRLYRGDSDFVKEFDPQKFDPKSLFGNGLYLTDSRHIASTYTTKGDKKKVVTTFYTKSKKEKDARLMFVILHVLQNMIKPGSKMPEHSMQYNQLQQSLFDYYEVLTCWETKYHPIHATDPMYATYNAGRLKDRKKFETRAKMLRKKYDVLLPKAWEIFNKSGKRYKFIASGYNVKEAETTWQVIDSEIKAGHISEFDISPDVVTNCYDAEQAIESEIMTLIDKIMFQSFSGKEAWGDTVASQQENYEFDKKHYPHTFESMGAFFYNCKSMRWDNACWDNFRAGMQEIGYAGIRYQGGKYTGSPVRHNAYVLWEPSVAKRVR